MLIADEIQTGFGRTGTMFASRALDLRPDLMTVAKSIAGGLPLAAVVGRATIMDAIPPGRHRRHLRGQSGRLRRRAAGDRAA